MAHNHLGFQLIDQVDGNTDEDQDRRTTEPNALSLSDGTEQGREQDDDDQEKTIDPVQAASCFGHEVRCRAARADARDKAAILLQVVGDFNRIELHHRVEERKAEDQDRVEGVIERIAGKIHEPFSDWACTTKQGNQG